MRFYQAVPDKNLIVDHIVKWIVDIVVVLVLALFVMHFFGTKVSVVGNSMSEELVNNDQVLINTLIYRLREPKRMDVIAFSKTDTNQNSTSYIKRIIGLPGETIQIKEGYIYINGELWNHSFNDGTIVNAGLASNVVNLAKNEYFVIGDKPNNSEDSRAATIGTVKKNEIKGTVWLIIEPFVRIGLVD